MFYFVDRVDLRVRAAGSAMLGVHSAANDAVFVHDHAPVLLQQVRLASQRDRRVHEEVVSTARGIDVRVLIRFAHDGLSSPQHGQIYT
jgi:hypothetical protein